MDFGDFRLTNWVLDDPAANPDMWWDDKMPLITPAYPTMNSLFAVSAATYRVMMCELSRGYADDEERCSHKIQCSDSTQPHFKKKMKLFTVNVETLTHCNTL